MFIKLKGKIMVYYGENKYYDVCVCMCEMGGGEKVWKKEGRKEGKNKLS